MHTHVRAHAQTQATEAGCRRGACGSARLLYLLHEAENFLSATTTSASTTQVASRAAITMAAMAPGPSEPAEGGIHQPRPAPRPAPRSRTPCTPPPWSSCSCAVLSSGPGADVGAGGPLGTRSWLGLVPSTAPSPDGSSAGSFHRVGSGSCGLSAARPRTMLCDRLKGAAPPWANQVTGEAPAEFTQGWEAACLSPRAPTGMGCSAHVRRLIGCRGGRDHRSRPQVAWSV